MIPFLFDWSGTLQVMIASIPIIAGVIVYVFQRIQNKNNRFKDCASSLQSENEEAQITAAILLRSFLNKWGYKTDTLNLISALLRVTPYGNLQKTLGDGLSYVKDADGQDFQHTNLHSISIKSKNQVRYELTGKRRYNKQQLFRRTDFFRSDITECSIYNVNFDKAIFYDTILCETQFHYCSFSKASFKEADLFKVVFDLCILKDVDFSEALNIESVKIKVRENDQKIERDLLNYLDEKGRFGMYHEKCVYNPPKKSSTIFLSHLGMMDSFQISSMRDIKGWLESSHKVSFADIERKDYRDSGQLRSIQNKMRQCSGVVILAFSYMTVDAGTIHEIKGDTICDIRNMSFSSPWLQIETALARSLGLPCLVFTQEGVLHNGFFDEKLVRNDDKMYMIDYRGSTIALTPSDKRKIHTWHKKVLQNS